MQQRIVASCPLNSQPGASDSRLKLDLTVIDYQRDRRGPQSREKSYVGSSDGVLVPSSRFVPTTGGVGNRSAHAVVLCIYLADVVADGVAFPTTLISTSLTPAEHTAGCQGCCTRSHLTDTPGFGPMSASTIFFACASGQLGFARSKLQPELSCWQ
jgi:hypothetical protein